MSNFWHPVLIAAGVIAATLAAPRPVSAQAPPSPPGMGTPLVQAGLFSLRPDGSVGGFAVDTAEAAGEDISGAVYLAPCGSLGAVSGPRPIPASATDVWKLSGRVLALTDTEASLHLTWQRARRSGQELSDPGETVTLTLRRGERTRLDTVALPAAGLCEERSAALDVVFASRDEMRGRGRAIASATGGGGFGSPGGRSVRDAAAGAGGGGGAGGADASDGGAAGPGSGAGAGSSSASASGSSSSSGIGAGTGSGSGSGSGFGGRGGGAFVTEGGTTRAIIGNTPRRGTPSADLWLVHTLPGAADETFHLTVPQVTSFPREFSFAPLPIRSASGVLTVTVQGTIETGLTPTGEPRLYFSANRRVAFAPSGRTARDTAPLIEGSTKTAVPLPAADDVLSFEMPPLRFPGGQALPNRLSIRVRLTPTPMPDGAKPR